MIQQTMWDHSGQTLVKPDAAPAPSVVAPSESLDQIRARMIKSLQLVFDIMRSGQWFTLWDLQKAIQDVHPKRKWFAITSVSARIRDLRAAGVPMEDENRGDGVWAWRVVEKGNS